MFSNKLYQALACLDAPGKRRLMRFLESPYFTQSTLMHRLCGLLLDALETSPEGFDRKTVWETLFPDKPFDDVNFRKHCSDLLKLLEQFMVCENMRIHPEKRATELMEYVEEHNIHPLNNSAVRQARRALEKHKYRTPSYFYQAYLIERIYYKMQHYDVKLSVRANLEEISGNLDFFYWLEKLRFNNAVLSQRKTGNQVYDLHFIDEIVDFLKAFPLEELPELALHYYTFLSLSDEENTEHYRSFRSILRAQIDHMPQEEAIEFYDSAMHFCVGRINKGDRDFLEEYFELLDEGMSKGVFISSSELAPWRYNNAVGAALGLGKIEWAEKFIRKNKEYLPIKTRENTFAFNLARVFRFQGKFREVLELLRDLEYEDIGYNLLSKRMVVMTYYDLDELDALESFIESFRVFLNRHKEIPPSRRKSYLKWLKYVKRLMTLLPGNQTSKEALKSEILQNKADIGNYEWLMEKLEE